jgi:hypothetical protein
MADVVLYEHANATGAAQHLSGGAAGGLAPPFNDGVSSIKVESRMVAILYENANFTGRAIVFKGNSLYNLPDFGFNDIASAYRVIDGTTSNGLFELLGGLSGDHVQYYDLRPMSEVRDAAKSHEKFLLGNKREAHWEEFQLKVVGLKWEDNIVKGKLFARHKHRAFGQTIFNVQVSPEFECGVKHMLDGGCNMKLDVGKGVKIPVTDLVGYMQSLDDL